MILVEISSDMMLSIIGMVLHVWFIKYPAWSGFFLSFLNFLLWLQISKQELFFQYDATLLFALTLLNTKWTKKINNLVKIRSKIGSKINLNTIHSRYAKTYSSKLIIRLQGLGKTWNTSEIIMRIFEMNFG